MNWLLIILSMGGGVIYGVSTNSGVYVDSLHNSREECQVALEAYAKKSGASQLTLACIEGESFKPVPQREHPKAAKSSE